MLEGGYLMISIETGKIIDGRNFEDVVRYENKSINDTDGKGSNVALPVFFKCILKKLSLLISVMLIMQDSFLIQNS
jgi:hypothetical protein